jgi:hypothetical protein
MALKVVKKTAEYTIYQRNDERYAVKDANKKPVNGEEKVKILLAEELIKLTAAAPAPVEEAPAEEEAAAEEPAADAGEEAAE